MKEMDKKDTSWFGMIGAQKFRALLPDYLNVKFPESLSNLFKCVCAMDAYLIKIPRNYIGDSFINIQSYLAIV